MVVFDKMKDFGFGLSFNVFADLIPRSIYFGDIDTLFIPIWEIPLWKIPLPLKLLLDLKLSVKQAEQVLAAALVATSKMPCISWTALHWLFYMELLILFGVFSKLNPVCFGQGGTSEWLTQTEP